VKRALSYPMKLIAKNAGVNGSVVVEKVGTFAFTVFFDMLFLVLLKSVHDNYYLGGSCHGSLIRVLIMWFNFKHECSAFVSLMTLQIQSSAMGF
jgi:uncharacterized membrane protein YjjB (DUF3815 family)